MMKHVLPLLLSALVVAAAGCAHLPLKRNVVKQSNTLADIYEQQVLNGLATFCVNPGSTPSFALPVGGGTTVNQAGAASSTFNFNSRTFLGAGLGINGNQQLAENWTLKPINDPIRLALIACVYQYVTCKDQQDLCVDCTSQLRTFFGDDFATCVLPQCFFQTSSKCPKASDCCVKFGDYCGTYVTVNACNFSQLSKVTLAVLEIATIPDDQLAKRMSRNDPRKIEIDTSFIANINGRPQLIHGKYSIPFTKFEEMQQYAIPELSKLSVAAPGFNAESAISNDRVLEFNSLNATPVERDAGPISLGDPNAEARIQSLLQMNQLINPQ